MEIEEKGVIVADPPAAEEEKFDGDGNLIIPPQEGDPDADKEPKKEPEEYEGRPVAEIYAENKRKAEALADLKDQNEKLLDTIHEGFTKPPVAAAPEQPIGMIDPALYEGDEALFSKEQAEAIRQLNVQAIQDYDTRVVLPQESKILDRADRADVNFIVADDATLKPYREEILDTLQKMPLDQRAESGAPLRAAEQVKGNHVNDIIKEAKAEAVKEVKRNRKILSENPAGTIVTTESGTYQLMPSEQEICTKTGVSPEKYLASKQRYMARKSVEATSG